MDLDHIFSHHPPTPEQKAKHDQLRDAARAFAGVIVEETPPCADQSAAVRHVREALMTANAAIALGGRL